MDLKTNTLPFSVESDFLGGKIFTIICGFKNEKTWKNVFP
jgi:hypothetical protein